MSKQTEEMINTGWKLVRDAGATVGEAGSRVSTSLVRTYPHVKEWLSAGAGLALARRGGKVAVTAIRRHPVAAIVGAVALAGVGLAVAAAKRRRKVIDGEVPARTSKRLTATNMRTVSGKSADAASKAKPRAARKPRAPRTPRVQKPAEA